MGSVRTSRCEISSVISEISFVAVPKAVDDWPTLSPGCPEDERASKIVHSTRQSAFSPELSREETAGRTSGARSKVVLLGCLVRHLPTYQRLPNGCSGALRIARWFNRLCIFSRVRRTSIEYVTYDKIGFIQKTVGDTIEHLLNFSAQFVPGSCARLCDDDDEDDDDDYGCVMETVSISSIGTTTAASTSTSTRTSNNNSYERGTTTAPPVSLR